MKHARTSPPLTEFENDPERPTAPMRRAGRFAAFTPPFNMSGQPAISLPLHRNAEGLPIGIQLAAYGREDVLIRISSLSRQQWSITRSPARRTRSRAVRRRVGVPVRVGG